MPDSIITVPGGSPSYLGQSEYTVDHSNGATFGLSLSLTSGASVLFSATSTQVGAGLQATLKQGAHSLDISASGTNSSAFPGRRVTVDATGTVLSVEIDETSGPVSNEAWTLELRALGAVQCVFDAISGVDVTRVLADPHAKIVNPVSPAAEPELQPLTITAESATTLGAGVPNAATAVNVIGPAPNTFYGWSYTGAATIMGFGVTTTNSTVVGLPNGNLTPAGSVHLVTWFSDQPAPQTAPGANDLQATAADLALTVTHRPQLLTIVLDRTGSMAGAKWNAAKTATRIAVALFGGIRSGNPDDNAAVLVFDDPAIGWHSPPASASLHDALTLSAIPVNAGTIAGLPAAPYDNPGANTNIGDALDRAYNDMYAKGSGIDARYRAVLITDGIENTGVYRIDHNTTGGVQYVKPAALELCTIGVGSYVQQDVLNSLAGAYSYQFVDDDPAGVGKLKQAIAFALSELFDANALMLTASPSGGDPDAAAHPNAVYFSVNSGERRLALALELATAGDTIEVGYRTDTGSFQVAAVPFDTGPTHAFGTIELASLFGGGAVTGTQWRVTLSSGGSNVTDLEKRLLAYVDLRAKADHVFDKQAYRTGEPVRITVRLRDGDQPILGAQVRVALKRPARSLGDFLARNAASVTQATAATTSFSLGKRGGRGGGVGVDVNAKSALLTAILGARGEPGLGWEEPSGIFVDGTNDLHDPDSVGEYSNVYAQTEKEGTISFTFDATATLPDGSTFARTLEVGKWVGVGVDPLASNVTVLYNQPAPAGFQAAIVRYRPVDRFGNLLGPFRQAELTFTTSVGMFEGPVVSRLDGTYEQTLVYKPGEGTPIVTVDVNGTSSIPIPVTKGCLGALLRPLLWLLTLLLKLARRL